MATTPLDPHALISMTCEIVIAELSHNSVPPEAVPTLIRRVYDSLAQISAEAQPAGREPPPADAAGDRPSVRSLPILPDRSTAALREPVGLSRDAEQPRSARGDAPSRTREAAHAAHYSARPARPTTDTRGGPWSPTPRPPAAAQEPSRRTAPLAPDPAAEVTRPTHVRTAREDGVEPAVPRDQSVFPEHIYCLFDGVKRKMLKRHIKTRYGMSPEIYRQYWELPDDYPMTAPNYSSEKREYAMLTGFGLPRSERRSGRTRAA